MPRAQSKTIEVRRHSRQGRKPRERGDEKLASLQKALLSLIGRDGPSGVTHRRVAREASVSLSATTYYFDSKQDMIRKAFQYLCDDLRTNIELLVERHGGPRRGQAKPVDEVAAAGQFLKSRLQADADENLTLIELMLAVARDEEARRLLSDDREAVRGFVVGLMERSHSSRPDEDADLLTALMTGLILESLARGRPADFEARAASLAERVMAWLVDGESNCQAQDGGRG